MTIWARCHADQSVAFGAREKTRVMLRTDASMLSPPANTLRCPIPGVLNRMAQQRGQTPFATGCQGMGLANLFDYGIFFTDVPCA